MEQGVWAFFMGKSSGVPGIEQGVEDVWNGTKRESKAILL